MTRPLVPPKVRWALLISLLLAAACTLPTEQPISTNLPAATSTAPPAAATPTLAPGVAPVLPHALYYLNASSGSHQVWRLERDGLTRSQITHESALVLSFDVSGSNGSVAYISANQLYLVESDGSNRRLLVDNASANSLEPEYYYTQRISDPLFSPDGRYLAYAYNGLWIVDLSSFQAVHLLENQIRTRDNGRVVLESYYAPLAWAPDGQRMLLTVGSGQSGSLAFLSFEGGPQVSAVDADPVCCHTAWENNGAAVLLANPYIGLVDPGLWRLDAASGESSPLFGAAEDGVFHFAGWPLALADGLAYFYATAAEVPTGDVPLYMVHSAMDGVSGRVQLRPDLFSNLTEVLWAEDGALALVLQVGPDGGPDGSVLLAATDGRQLQLLLDGAHGLKWGQ